MSGSLTIWHGYGSADRCLWLTDPDPALFVSDLQHATKNIFCLLLLLFERTFISFFKDDRVLKMSRNCRNLCFSYKFILMIAGSGSGRPKNLEDREHYPVFCCLLGEVHEIFVCPDSWSPLKTGGSCFLKVLADLFS